MFIMKGSDSNRGMDILVFSSADTAAAEALLRRRLGMVWVLQVIVYAFPLSSFFFSFSLFSLLYALNC